MTNQAIIADQAADETQVIETKAVVRNAAAMIRAPLATLEFAKSFVIDDDESYEIAGDELKDIKDRISKLEAERLNITRPMDAAKKAVMALFAPPVETLAEAEKIIKTNMLGYFQEQQRIADEARRKAEREAQEQREKMEQEAAALRDEGQTSEAVVVETAASMVIATPVSVATPKASGVSIRGTIDFEVDDLHALIKHVGQHPELINLLTVDTVKLRAYVRGLGTNCALPGVRVFTNQSIASRKR